MDLDARDSVRPSGARCLEHGLVAGADGRCVVCRRAREGVVAPTADLAATEAVATDAIPSRADSAKQRRTMLLIGGGFAALLVAAIAAYALRSSDDVPVATLTPSASLTPVASIRAADLGAASQRVNVRMYSTSWCGVCSTTRAWFRQRHIRFVEYDVESSPSAQRRLRELNPRGSVPTIEVERQVLIGFAPQRLESAIWAAAAATPRR